MTFTNFFRKYRDIVPSDLWGQIKTLQNTTLI
jgi:hypothetical protein